MLKDNIIIYFHIATIGQYQEIVDEIILSLTKTKLINLAKTVNICIVGNGEIVLPNSENILIKRSENIALGEFFTLKLIEDYCNKTETNDKILYIHTKGVTTPNNECINDWRKYMLYFNVEKYEDAIKDLDTYDTYGVDLVSEPTKHYSGNFWWANTNHIKRLPSIDDISKSNAKSILTPRHNAEFWLMMKDGNNKSAHNSNINVYERHLHRYNENNYIKCL